MSRRHLASFQHWEWNFPGGSAMGISEENGSIRITPRIWSGTWAHYAIRSNNVGGKTPKFILNKATRWITPPIEENVGVWSTGLDTDTWYNFDNQVSDGVDIELYNNKPFPNGTIYVAHMALYPLSRLFRKYSEWRTKDSRITPLNIGQDIRRSNGDGRTAAALPFIGFKITNASGFSKNKIILTGGNHPSEYQGMYQIEGLVEFLLSGEVEAEFLLDWANIWIYPLVNPQGVDGGWFRCSPVSSTDNNRLWDGSGVSTSVDAFKASFAADVGSPIDCGLDFHGSLGNGGHYQSCGDHTQPLNVLWDTKMEILLGTSNSYTYADETIVSMLRQLFENSYSSIFAISPENKHLKTQTQPAEFKMMGKNSSMILSSFIGGRQFSYGPDLGSRLYTLTTDRIDWASPHTPINGNPFSFSTFVTWSSFSANDYMICIHDAADTSFGIVINLVSGSSINFIRNWTTVDYIIYKGVTLTANILYHIAVTNTGGNTINDTKFYLNGSELTSPLLSSAGSGSETTHSGSYSLGGRIYDDIRNHAGRLSQAATWDIVLTAIDVKRLAFGVAAENIQPSNLKFYFKGNTTSLVASPGGTGTADGTTHLSGVGNGPGIIY